jgi:NitT/TauT family transport system substrate-binding protein
MSVDNRRRTRTTFALVALATVLHLGVSTASAEEDLPVFKTAAITNPDPSLWAIQLMKEKQIDRKHGFDLQFTLKPVSVAYSEFINGTDQVCLCLTIATAARFTLEGVDVSLVSTYNNYGNAYLVTENKDIQKPADLSGHSLAGSTGSGSWVFQQYFLREHQNVDLAKVEIPSVVASAQATNLIAGRVDAITVFDDGRLKLEAAQPDRFRFIPTFDKEKWKTLTGIDYVPMFLLGVRTGWYDKVENRELFTKFQGAYKETVDYAIEHPAETADLLGEDKTLAPKEFVVNFLTRYPDAGRVIPASELKSAIAALTQKVLPGTGLIDRPLTDQEVKRLIVAQAPAEQSGG